MKPPAIASSPSWPCANCRTAVSSERCPRCQGVQVRVVLDDHHTPKDNSLSKVWLERLSPALALRTPTRTPTKQLGGITANDTPNNHDMDEDDRRRRRRYEYHYHHDDDDEDGFFRPVDPVACILGSAPSPMIDSQQKVFNLREIEDHLRSRKRPFMTAVTAELPGDDSSSSNTTTTATKKTKWLSAA